MSTTSAAAPRFVLRNQATGYVLGNKGRARYSLLCGVPADQFTEWELWAWSGDGAGSLLSRVSGLSLGVASSGVDLLDGSGQWRSGWVLDAEGFFYNKANPDNVLTIFAGTPGVFTGVSLRPRESKLAALQRWVADQSVAEGHPQAFRIVSRFMQGTVRTSTFPPSAGGQLVVDKHYLDAGAGARWQWSGDGLLSLAERPGYVTADPKARVAWQNAPLGAATPPAWRYTPTGTIVDDATGRRFGLGYVDGHSVVTAVPANVSPETFDVRRDVTPQPALVARAARTAGQLTTAESRSPSDEWTLETWLRIDPAGSTKTALDVARLVPVFSGPAIRISVSNDTLLVTLQTPGMPADKFSIPKSGLDDGEWHHLALVMTPRQLRAVVDGVVGSTKLTRRTTLGQYRIALGPGMPRRTPQAFVEFAEVRFWNVVRTRNEISDAAVWRLDPSTPGLINYWTFDADNGNDSRPGGQPLNVASAVFVNSAVQVVAAGDFRLVVQATLMEDWKHSTAPSAPLAAMSAYRVSITIRDGDNVNTPGFVTLSIDNPAVTKQLTLHLDSGDDLVLTTEHPSAVLATDANGLLSFAVDANGSLGCPLLRAHGDFMAPDTWVLVAPDRLLHERLASVTGATVAKAYTTPPTPAAADAAAASIRQLMQAASPPRTGTTVAQMRPLTAVLPVSIPAAAAALQRTHFPDLGPAAASDVIPAESSNTDVPMVRQLLPAQATEAHWSYDFGAMFQPHDSTAAANVLGKLASLTPHTTDPWTKQFLPKFDPRYLTTIDHEVAAGPTQLAAAENILTTTGLGSWLVKHISAAAHVVVTTLRSVVTETGQEIKHLVVTAVDAARNGVYAVVQAVEHAVDLVTGILQRIKADIVKFIELLREIFEWPDVLHTYRILRSYVSNVTPFVKQVTHGAASLVTTDLERLRTAVEARMPDYKQRLGDSPAGNKIRENNQGQPPPVKTAYLSNLVSKHGADASKSAVLDGGGAFPQVVDEILAVLQKHEFFDGGDLLSRLKQTQLQKVRGPRAVLEDGIELAVVLIDVVLDAIFKGLEALTAALIALLDRMLDALTDVLESGVTIPVVTRFWKDVVMAGAGAGADRSLSAINVVCLISAMTATFAYKVTHDGAAPYSAADAQQFEQLTYKDYHWLRNPFAPTRAAEPGATTAETTAESTADKWNLAIGVGALGVTQTIAAGLGGVWSDRALGAHVKAPVDTFIQPRYRYPSLASAPTAAAGFHFSSVMMGTAALIGLAQTGVVAAQVAPAAATDPAASGSDEDADIGVAAMAIALQFYATASALGGGASKKWGDYGDPWFQLFNGAVATTAAGVIFHHQMAKNPPSEEADVARTALGANVLTTAFSLVGMLRFVIMLERKADEPPLPDWVPPALLALDGLSAIGALGANIASVVLASKAKAK